MRPVSYNCCTGISPVPAYAKATAW